MSKSPLELDRETMRRMGYQVIDYLVERISTLNEQPAWRGITPAELEPLLKESPPEHAHEFDTLIARLRDDVLAYGVRVDHPRFFAFVPGSPTWPGILGDTIAAAHQSFAGTWLGGAGVAQLELVVLDWFREWLQLPATTSGLLLSGGSAANLTAIAAARINMLGENFANATIYFSTETHSAVARACRVLGFRNDQLRIIETDADDRISIPALENAIAEDEAAGRTPFCIIGNGGATSTGAIDPLQELARVSRARAMWFHVDAAYGGFAGLTERGQRWLRGIEHADSIALDPHKWLHQPFEAGCLLVRDPACLARAFHILPHYMQDTAVQGSEVNFGERGIQLTRAARALKIWLSIQFFGAAAFRSAIDAALDLAVAAQEMIEASSSLELMTPARLGIVCFRRRADDATAEAVDALNELILKRLAASGFAMLSSTRIDGRFALRLCILNHRTTLDDVSSVLNWIETA